MTAWPIPRHTLVLRLHQPDALHAVVQNAMGPLSLGPQWGLVQGWGTCCGYPVEGTWSQLCSPACS